MNESPSDHLIDLLRGHGHDVAELIIDGAASAGANRQTLMVGLVFSNGDQRRAVAQITSRPEYDQTLTLSVAAEAEIINTAGQAGLPVPTVLASGHSPSLDADVLITGRVEGETIPRKVLRALDASPGRGAELAAACGRTLAKLHTVSTDGLSPDLFPADVAGQHRPSAYLEHLHERLDGLQNPYPVFRFGLARLAEHLPEPAEPATLVHGDFRNGNLIVDPAAANPGSTADSILAAVLDWELAHLGDPMEDLAWLCLRTWRFGHDQNEVGGFGSLQQLRAAYQEAGGQWRQDGFDWWTAARTIWWGIGLAGQAAKFVEERSDAAQDPPSTSIVHAASGRRVVELEYDLLTLLPPYLK